MPERRLTVIIGLVVAFVSLVTIVASGALSPNAAAGPWGWRSVVLAIASGIGLAAGLAAVGIGIGRWTRPRRPLNEADYTGPGHISDSSHPPKVV